MNGRPWARRPRRASPALRATSRPARSACSSAGDRLPGARALSDAVLRLLEKPVQQVVAKVQRDVQSASVAEARRAPPSSPRQPVDGGSLMEALVRFWPEIAFLRHDLRRDDRRPQRRPNYPSPVRAHRRPRPHRRGLPRGRVHDARPAQPHAPHGGLRQGHGRGRRLLLLMLFPGLADRDLEAAVDRARRSSPSAPPVPSSFLRLPLLAHGLMLCCPRPTSSSCSSQVGTHQPPDGTCSSALDARKPLHGGRRRTPSWAFRAPRCSSTVFAHLRSDRFDQPSRSRASSDVAAHSAGPAARSPPSAWSAWSSPPASCSRSPPCRCTTTRPTFTSAAAPVTAMPRLCPQGRGLLRDHPASPRPSAGATAKDGIGSGTSLARGPCVLLWSIAVLLDDRRQRARAAPDQRRCMLCTTVDPAPRGTCSSESSPVRDRSRAGDAVLGESGIAAVPSTRLLRRHERRLLRVIAALWNAATPTGPSTTSTTSTNSAVCGRVRRCSPASWSSRRSVCSGCRPGRLPRKTPCSSRAPSRRARPCWS